MSEYAIFHYLLPGAAAALGPISYLLVRLILIPWYSQRHDSRQPELPLMRAGE